MTRATTGSGRLSTVGAADGASRGATVPSVAFTGVVVNTHGPAAELAREDTAACVSGAKMIWLLLLPPTLWSRTINESLRRGASWLPMEGGGWAYWVSGTSFALVPETFGAKLQERQLQDLRVARQS